MKHALEMNKILWLFLVLRDIQNNNVDRTAKNHFTWAFYFIVLFPFEFQGVNAY